MLQLTETMREVLVLHHRAILILAIYEPILGRNQVHNNMPIKHTCGMDRIGNKVTSLYIFLQTSATGSENGQKKKSHGSKVF